VPKIFAIVRDIADEPVAGCKVAFRPQTMRPGASGADVRGTADLVVTTSVAGFFSQQLRAGSYYLWIGTSGRASIWVPETPDYILLADLFAGATGGTATQGSNWRLDNAERQLLNADTGDWQSVVVNDDAGLKTLGASAAGDGGATANFRYRSGMLEIYCTATNTWHAPYLVDGEMTLAADGATPFENDRFIAGTWQIKDTATGHWRSWFITGAAGDETVSFGIEEG